MDVCLQQQKTRAVFASGIKQTVHCIDGNMPCGKVLAWAMLFYIVPIASQSAKFYTFAVLSDLHIGTTETNAGGKARSAVAKINQLARDVSTNLQAVFVTGDLTDSAMPSQYKTVRKILDQLVVPYFPIIGNHDLWAFNATWKDISPTGDRLFTETFEHILNQSTIINYSKEAVWNSVNAYPSWFQNYRLRIQNNVSASFHSYR